jgi:hypothetical protein
MTSPPTSREAPTAPPACEFCMPTTLVHGAGVAGEVGERAKSLSATRVLTVSDPGVSSSGLLDGRGGRSAPEKLSHVRSINDISLSPVLLSPKGAHVSPA